MKLLKGSQKYKILKWAFETRKWLSSEEFMKEGNPNFVGYEARARMSELYKAGYLNKCSWKEKRTLLTHAQKRRALYRVNTEKLEEISLLFEEENDQKNGR